tara:strand:+ start:7653 stop:8786 length:1134 start_codon:yes stop_codon:yes gene_type:complete
MGSSDNTPRYKVGHWFNNYIEGVPKNKPSISILFSSVFKERSPSNPRLGNAKNLALFINSIINTTTEEERERLEIIIKFDTQDDLDWIKNNFGEHIIYFDKRSDHEDRDLDYGDLIKSYKGLAIRCVVYDKSEGRASIHDFLSYMGSIAHPDSVLYFNVADDFIFLRKNWVTDLLSTYKKAKKEKNGFCIIGPCSTKQIEYTNEIEEQDKVYYYNKERDGELYPWDEKMMPINEWSSFPDVTPEIINNIASGAVKIHDTPLHKYIGEYCPVFSKEVYDAISGNFWMPSIDAYFTFLGAILAKKFDLSITTRIQNFYSRNTLTVETPPENQHREWTAPVLDYNYNTFSGAQQIIRNCKRLFSLITQQALNIKLNLKND